MKYHLITLHSDRDVDGEFKKYKGIIPYDKAKTTHRNIYHKDSVIMFRRVETLNDAYAAGAGFWFTSVKFNGMIDPDAREFLMSRIIGAK